MFGVDDALLVSVGVPALTGLASGVMSWMGGNAQADAAREAAKLQNDASTKALGLQQEQFNQQRQDLEPWRASGVNALGQLNNLAPFAFGQDQFQQDPSYQFRLKEGLKAVQNSAAARGGLLSGATMKAMNNYSQGVASDEYTNAFNRALTTYNNRVGTLQSLAGIGQTATNQVGQAGQNFANNAGNLQIAGANALAGGYTGAANATASGYVNGANALNNAITSAYNNYQNQQWLNKLLPPATVPQK